MIHHEPAVYVLTGACSTGKTSLLEHYKAEPSIVTVEEAAREFYAQNVVPVEQRSSLANQENMQDFYIARYETARSSDVDTIVCDSSPLSSVAYAGLKSQVASRNLLERIESTWMPQVTEFLLLDPRDISYELDPADAIRKETPEQRLAVQAILLSVLTKTGVPFTLISGDLEQRIAQIDAIMANK